MEQITRRRAVAVACGGGVVAVAGASARVSARPQAPPVGPGGRNGPGETGPKLVARKPSDAEALTYDAGKVRFVAAGAETQGRWSVVELFELPGYKTPLHRHDHFDEAYYVLEGVLTAQVAGRVYELPSGSYLVIPRGTPHAQGNFGKGPLKTLLTVTPSGFEQFFRDRVELFKTVKPEAPEFMERMTAIAGKYDLVGLGPWEGPRPG